MHKIKVDFSKPLPWRDNYVETLMAYKGRRIDRVTAGGGRDFSHTGSGPRSVMAVKFANGELQPLYPTERGELNGMEQSYIESDWGTFVRGEGDQIILDVIKDDYEMDEYITIIHANVLRRGEVAVSFIPKMMRHHANYGFDILPVEGWEEMLQPGQIIKAEQRLSHTRATMPSGDFGHGREANCVFYSSFSTNEDTCAVLDTVLDDFAVAGTEEFLIPANNDNIPHNRFGKDGSYRGVPRVGDILEDGVVMSVRRRNKDNALATMTHKALKNSKHPFDTPYICKRGAEVIAVEVIRATTSKIMNKYMPTELVTYLDAEAAKSQQRYHRILALHQEYKKRNGDAWNPHPSWNILVRDAIARLYGPKLKQYYPKGYGKNKEVHGTIDDNVIPGYLIRVKVRSIIKPHLGHKFNDAYGAKYVISEIRNKERMFKDKWGRVCEFMTNGVANVNRGIYGRLHAQFRGDARFHLLRNMREIYDSQGYEAAADYYMDGIKILSDKTYWKLIQLTESVLERHIRYILNDAPFIQLDDEIGDESLTSIGAAKIVNSPYDPPRAKLDFVDYRGRSRKTVMPVRIGSMYISINEKIGSDYSACNIPMCQHSGISRKLSSADKKTTQVSHQSSRAYSEADFRMLYDSQPAEDAKLIQRDGTSPTALKETTHAILDGAYVPDIEIDATDSRGMEVFKAELATDGVELTNVPRYIRWGNA